MNSGPGKASGLFQRMCFGIQLMHVLNLQHGIGAAIQPGTIFDGGEIRLRGCLSGEPVKIERESVGLYWLYTEWSHAQL